MNVIKLSGVVNDAPKFSHECKGENFYTFDIATERRSGYVDVIPCVVPELLVGMIEQYGKYMVLGEVRTRNVKAVDSSRIRCEVSVFVKNVDEYWNEVNKASIKYCNGIKELREYCGGNLHRQRNGFAGINGNIEYVAERI